MSGRQITKHFNEDELRCQCGCGRMEFSDKAVRFLEALRGRYGRAIRINSGYRCPEHNDSVSSTGPNGPHTVTANQNITVDIQISGEAVAKLLYHAINLGFTGIGVKQKGNHAGRFIHLDMIMPAGRHPRPRVWSY
ncbi:hypothetical protein LCGC14_1567150 [marine sediment metagenome]|uniref:Peptidase M15A C-terminal domain-containing protein n=1 Tax=marine sediment metagenome TaxID=412755 RepID=A0A0F9IKP9_9ZZZZ